ncbi:MAG: transporter permease subunit [Devosia sp.]|nr:transporter permease subunit [Devosia sp.]
MAGITGKDAALTAYADALAAEAPKGRSLTQDALRRLFNNKAALVSIFVLIAIVLFALIGPYFLPWAYDKIDWAGIRKPPDWAKGHYFGTDQNGRDMLARTLQGTQMSLLVAAVATFVSVVIGILYGAIAGYFGGKVDAIMMRFVDIMYALPYILFVIILVVIFGRSPVLLFVGIGCLEWLTIARVHRGGEGRWGRALHHHLPPYRTQPHRSGGDLCDAHHSRDHHHGELPLLSRPRCAGTADLARHADLVRRSGCRGAAVDAVHPSRHPRHHAALPVVSGRRPA